MRERGITSNFLAGVLMLVFGAAAGALLLLEKNGQDAILGTGTSITTAVLVGVLLMSPGTAIVLRSFRISEWERRVLPGGAFSRLIEPGFWLLLGIAAAALLFLVYNAFGLTLRLSVPKSTIAWNIASPMTDYFHEGEIIGSLGFFTSEGPRDFPLIIHGPGRNLLPAWIVSQFGTAGTMVAEMRFITAVGNFLGLSLATVGALTAALIIARRQALAVLSPAGALALAATGTLVAMTLVATLGTINNREIILFAVVLISLLLIWSAGSGRRRLAGGLAVLLGVVAMLSPLHTYLGSVQSVMTAFVAAIVTLVLSPGFRVGLLLRGVLGASAAFIIVSLMGGYWLFHDAVTTTLYWAEHAGPIWSRYAPRPVLVGTLALMAAGATLGGFALAGKAAGMQDGAVRGVLALLASLIVISTYSYANLSDFNHFGFALYICAAVIASVVTLLLLVCFKVSAVMAFGLTVLLVVPAAARLLTMEGSGFLQAVALRETPDEDILPPAFFEFTTRYRMELAGEDCLLVMSNDGALAYLPNLPLCGPTFNPIHLDPEGDRMLADWLEANPRSLVVDGADGHGAVGGAPMRQRLPYTYEVIDRDYPRVERLHLWEIRLR